MQTEPESRTGKPRTDTPKRTPLPGKDFGKVSDFTDRHPLDLWAGEQDLSVVGIKKFVTLRQRTGSMTFQHDMTPAQAVALSQMILLAVEYLESGAA